MSKRSLEEHYESLQKRFTPTSRPEWARLVVPSGNSVAPFHRWFHLKEAFSSQLIASLLRDLGLTSRHKLAILDPYAGAGTTLVSSLQATNEFKNMTINAYGIELNPFLHLLAETKVRSMTTRPKTFGEYSSRIVSQVSRGRVNPAATPRLSTFSNTAYFPRANLQRLLQLRAAIATFETAPLNRRLAQVCLASVIEPASRLRRDGRALRHEPSKIPADVLEEFLHRCSLIEQDLRARRPRGKGTVFLGDARVPEAVLPASIKYDLVVFSPPYPNNIDYTEIYKLENWLLGFIDSPDRFRQQRLKTVRSHPSILFPETYAIEANGHRHEMGVLISPLLDAIPSDEDRAWRVRLVRGYFDDMGVTLEKYRRYVRSGGRLVYVVGNSLHGSGEGRFTIAADLLMASMAEWFGFAVEGFYVTRRPVRRRREELIRESIVVLRAV